MNDDTRAVAHALSNYAEHTNNGSTGSIETRLEFEHATAILRENDIRNQPGRHDPLREYETTLHAAAYTFDYLTTALSEATGRTRAEVYTDLRKHITGPPTP